MHKDLSGELAAILAIEGGNTVSLGVVALLERLQGTHEVVATSHTVGDDAFGDTSSDGTLDNGSHGVHGADNLGLELGRDVKLNLLEEVFGGTETTDNQDVLERTVLSLNGDNLVADEFENTVDNGLKALQNFLVGESHVAFFNASLRELRFDTDIDSPLLAVVAEISLDSVLEIHDTLGVNAAGNLGSIGQLHLANLGAENIAKVAVKSSGTARITGTSCAFSNGEGVLIFDFVGDQIDGTTATVDDEDGIADLEVQETSLGAEESSGFGLRNKGQAVIVFVTEETGLDGSVTGSSLASIIPNSRHGEIVSDVTLFSVKDFTEGLLQGSTHGLTQLEEVVGSNVDFGLARRQRREVDGVNVCVTTEHELELEPFHLLHTGLGVTSGR